MYNTLKTFILLAALTALFVICGQLLGGKTGAVIALVLAGVMNFFAYWYSDKFVLKMTGAREVSPAEAPELHNIVAKLAAQAGIPKPRVFIMDTDTPNAFATGRNPEKGVVAVTRGIMQILNRDELEGVLAHEIAHIKNRDILISSIAAVIAGAIAYLADMASWSLLFGGLYGDDEDNGVLGYVGIFLMIFLAPLAAMIIQMAVSRSREYLADATGAKICRCPMSLARALEKLDAWNRQVPMQVNPAQAQMFIVNPLAGGSFYKLFSTHPPIEDRIAKLVEMARREGLAA
ncbi:peptidase M48 Ste24p [Thermodesulfatator indicus DSM 15286]|uniref:Protease HtpX homolog n=1 Tax=Thermodesulfatator indicus (strain DSM 15286 / JCM 11887 / CIR29812) TaxID=667014 RepID=F8AB79_THEID|nr:zinc metalloprotease HtpX [Thermodesulfatator indicus]AEH45535.1 peptidase M48 Ste24p [Thermodesulfatator indicus DSM 15286]